MNRLTKDNYVDDGFTLQTELNELPEYKNNHYTESQYDVDLWNKVKAIEDIEEEIGLDLITLFKAIKQGHIFRKIYLSEKDLEVEKFEIIKQDIDLLNFEESYKSNAILHCACFGKTEEQGNYKQCYQYLNYLNDYGKTWALTREELEDE